MSTNILQIVILVAGINVCLAAAAIALDYSVLVGLPMIALTSVFTGFACTRPKTLENTRVRMQHFVESLWVFIFMQAFMYIAMVVSYSGLLDFGNRFDAVYTHVTLTTALVTAAGWFILGQIVRVRWNGFRI